MKSYIDENSIIYSDGWRGYNQTNRIFREHLTVNHSIGFLNYENNCPTNSNEGNWSAIKSKIGRIFRTNDFIDIYLIRFMLKRNENGNVFNNLIKYLF